jgi:hypothetical protein
MARSRRRLPLESGGGVDKPPSDMMDAFVASDVCRGAASSSPSPTTTLPGGKSRDDDDGDDDDDDDGDG